MFYFLAQILCGFSLFNVFYCAPPKRGMSIYKYPSIIIPLSNFFSMYTYKMFLLLRHFRPLFYHTFDFVCYKV